jgi:hypothetical protein
MAAQRLARARSGAGAPLRRLDLEVVRGALGGLLRAQWEQGHLIMQLVVEGRAPAHVAAERCVSRPALVEQLHTAVGLLACRYEHLANDHLNERPAVSLPAALGGKRA